MKVHNDGLKPCKIYLLEIRMATSDIQFQVKVHGQSVPRLLRRALGQNPSRHAATPSFPSSTSLPPELAGGEPGRRRRGPNSSEELTPARGGQRRPTMARPEVETAVQLGAVDPVPLWPDLASRPTSTFDRRGGRRDGGESGGEGAIVCPGRRGLGTRRRARLCSPRPRRGAWDGT